ncbi:MAG: GNAT family protein [Dermatophilaceae bacterium]
MSALWPSMLRVRRADGEPDVVLRALRGRDRVQWEALRAANQDWLMPWEATLPWRPDSGPLGQLRFGQLVRSYDRDANRAVLQPFCIEVGGRLVGQMHLTRIEWGSVLGGKAGYWVAREAAGRGVASTALAALVDHAFLGIGLHRVSVEVRPDNAASLRVVRRLGFRHEGTQRRAMHIAGEWRDLSAFAMTVEDLDGASLVAKWNALRSASAPVAEGGDRRAGQ